MAKSKTKSKVSRMKRKSKSYGAYALCIALAITLIGEYVLINASSDDWKVGLTVLDMSQHVNRTAEGIKFAFEPMHFTIESIDEFYEEAVIAATPLLDFSDQAQSPVQIVYDINEFYKVATNEMVNVLDLSNYISKYTPQIAGASVSY